MSGQTRNSDISFGSQIKSILESKIVTGVGVAGFGVLTAMAIANRRPFDPNQLIPQKLIFPRDLENYPLSMSFDIMEYKRRSIYKQPFLNLKGQIRLPVSKGIADKFSMNWASHNQSPIVGAATEELLKAGNPLDENSLVGAIGSAGSAILDGIGGAAAGFTLGAANRAVSGLSNVIESSGGKIELSDILQPLGFAANPFLTVLFKQPEFKTHNFTWKFIPRDPEEARIINKIIRLFKLALLPDIANGSGGTLMNYPNIIQIGFYGGDNYLYRFKPCAIRNFTSNYAPAATPSFFKGSQNVPTEIDISMDLLEIEYWTKEDLKTYDANTEEAPMSVSQSLAAGRTQ